MPDINCSMDKSEIRYALSKQTSSMEYIHTNYGNLELDSEMIEAVQEALERVLYKRIDQRPPVDTLVVELADVQREEMNKMVNQTGVDDDSLAQIIFDWGFEPMADMARMIQKR